MRRPSANRPRCPGVGASFCVRPGRSPSSASWSRRRRKGSRTRWLSAWRRSSSASSRSLARRPLPLTPLMCGIVGYVGGRPCKDLLVAGLERLEYRGYDSAGISLLHDGHIDSVRAVGNLENLRAAVAETGAGEVGGAVAVAAPPATIGLAHTRWATHGRVTEENAHPHGDCSDRIHIVLNGIVENHAELRRELVAEGHFFSSETDAEIVAHLIERAYDGDLTAAVRTAFREIRGHYAFVAMHADHPSELVAARLECPLVIGLGEGETFVASAIPAFLNETRE